MKQPVLKPEITIWITRHVESVQNFLGKDATRHLTEDQILPTAKGREQGHTARSFLEKEFLTLGITQVVVLTSPIKRARETANLLAPDFGPISYNVKTLEALGETALVPRDPLNPGPELPRGEGLFGRALAGLDITQRDLLDRLRSIPAEINRLAVETGLANFLLITHKTTGRLLMGTQFAGIDIDDLDGFRQFGNSEIIRYDGETLTSVYPEPMMMIWPIPVEMAPN